MYGPVKGLSYTCGDLNGLTSEDGAYTYYPNETTTFYLGDMVLGHTRGKARITPYDFFEDSSKSQEQINSIVTHMSRLFLALDSDNNPTNGITISPDTASLFGHEQSYYPLDLCRSFDFQGVSYRIFYDSPDDDGMCIESDHETLVHVQLSNTALNNDEETSFLFLDKNEFETHPALANLMLNAFADDTDEDTITCTYYSDDENKVTGGWYSPYWSLPQRFWSYQRELALKHMSLSLYEPYKGVYSGSYSGSDYSGMLNFQVTFNTFSSCLVKNEYGTTCLGYHAEIVSDSIESDTGTIRFFLPYCRLLFEGVINPDTGTLTGSFYDDNDELAGSFSCERLGF